MRIVAIEPHPQLRPYVLSYRIVEDIIGEVSGTPLWTCPEPVGILSANFGNPSYHESGELHPRTGLLGVQTHARRWISQPETSFVMAMLTVAGMMALFSNIGQDSANGLLDLSNIWGERKAAKFWHSFPHELQSDTVKSALDDYLLGLFNAVSVSTTNRCLQFHRALLSNRRIDKTCEQLGITQRMLQRQFRRHLGVSPKQVLNLHRLQHSLRVNLRVNFRVNRSVNAQISAQTPLQEFSDQAHEIRTWRRYLGRTPSQYRTAGRSAVAEAFDTSAQRIERDPTVFYL